MSGESKLWLTRQERQAIEQLLRALRTASRENRPVTVLVRQTPPGICQVYETVLMNGQGRVDRESRK